MAVIDKENVNLCKNKSVSAKNGGVSVIWKHLKVTVPITKQNLFRFTSYTYKEIIHSVNGCIKPNTLVAILGASGSGKSTLMTALANRQSGDLRVRGDVYINGRKMQMKYMRLISGFVYQDDLFVPVLTVTEHLNLVAQIKLDRKINSDSRKKIIQDLLTDVGLLKCANMFIGSSHFGEGKINLSGGERKRLSVATELITNPDLLFCDEPTTGLDSHSALNIMSIMKNMTEQKNRTIICSIHQPNPQIFELFDHILLLHNGDIAFSGSTEDALTFFRDLGFPYNEDENLAEYLVKSVAIVPGREEETAQLAYKICNEFSSSEYAKKMNDYIENEKPVSDFMISNKIETVSWFFWLYLMVHRNFLEIIRDPFFLHSRLLFRQLHAVLLGLVLMGTVTMTQEGLKCMAGALSFLVLENSWASSYLIIRCIPQHMPIFYREYSNNTNSLLIFYLSTVIAWLPTYLIDPFVYTAILYWLSGLKNDLYTFLTTSFVVLLCSNTAAAFGILVSLITGDDLNNTMTFQAVVNYLLMILSGVYVKLKSIPAIFYWIRFVSWITNGVEALYILQFQDVNYIACAPDTNVPCLKNGTDVLNQLDFSQSNFWQDIFLIFGSYLILHMVSFYFLAKKLNHRTRKR